MTQDDFERLQTLLASRAGFRLTRDRMHLAEHRLGPVARREGFLARFGRRLNDGVIAAYITINQAAGSLIDRWMPPRPPACRG